MKDMAMKGRMGEMNRLTQRDRNKARDLYCLGWNRTVIAEMLNIDRATVIGMLKNVDLEYMQKLTERIDNNEH